MDLIKKVRQRIESPENQRRLALQAALNRKHKVFAFNSWRWGGGLSLSDAATPIPGMSIREIALRLGEVDTDFARAIIARQLESQLDYFDVPISDVPIATQIFTNLGLSWLYQPGPFQEMYKVQPDTGAFISLPALHSSGQWPELPQPAFQVDADLHCRRMQLFHELTGGEFPLLDDLIPLPIGSIFGAASRLRGDAELLMDFRLCPDEVHGLMHFLVNSARDFNTARARFMEDDPWSNGAKQRSDYQMYIFASVACIGGMPMYLAGEDHVSANMFSADDYLEFIFPYQKEMLAAFPKWYVHSCGNLTPFYKHLATLPNLHRVHVSFASDLETAADALGNSVILEVHQPLDFDTKSEAEIDRLADRMVDLCSGRCTVDVVLSHSANGLRFKKRVLAKAQQG